MVDKNHCLSHYERDSGFNYRKAVLGPPNLICSYIGKNIRKWNNQRVLDEVNIAESDKRNGKSLKIK